VVIGIHDLGLFVVSGLLLNITPGPDTLYIVGRSSSQGYPAGAVAALGIGTGTLVHIGAAALGLSALLAASASAFTALKIAGAVYLVYVGLSMMRTSGVAAQSTADPHVRALPMRAIFLQGFLTNALNPKVALFFLAFLPLFVAPDAPSKPLAFLFLGAVFDVNGTLWNLLVAWSSARLSDRLKTSAGFKMAFNRCVGGFFVLLGIRLATAHQR
jgi:threonine/homoserine/homoserine lactone efflux protein